MLENFLYKKSIYAIIGWICGNTEEQDNYMYQRYVMEQYVIKGGNPLSGEVNIIGAKNAALAIIAAAIMADETVTIDNVPDVSDIRVLLGAVASIGAVVESVDRHTYKINGALINTTIVDYEKAKKIRGSYYLLGALLGKYREAHVAFPGGCNIGTRPIDQHINGFKAMGAEVDTAYGMITAKADRLVGGHIYLDMESVGATINIMLAAVLGRRKHNYRECSEGTTCG